MKGCGKKMAEAEAAAKQEEIATKTESLSDDAEESPVMNGHA